MLSCIIRIKAIINAIEGVVDTDVTSVLDYVKEWYDFGDLDMG